MLAWKSLSRKKRQQNSITIQCQKVYARKCHQFEILSAGLHLLIFSFMIIDFIIDSQKKLFFLIKFTNLCIYTNFQKVIYSIRTKMIADISGQMTKYFFYIWSKTLRQRMFSYFSDVRGCCIRKFITSFSSSKIYPLSLYHQYILSFCSDSYPLLLVRLIPLNLPDMQCKSF